MNQVCGRQFQFLCRVEPSPILDLSTDPDDSPRVPADLRQRPARNARGDHVPQRSPMSDRCKLVDVADEKDVHSDRTGRQQRRSKVRVQHGGFVDNQISGWQFVSGVVAECPAVIGFALAADRNDAQSAVNRSRLEADPVLCQRFTGPYCRLAGWSACINRRIFRRDSRTDQLGVYKRTAVGHIIEGVADRIIGLILDLVPALRRIVRSHYPFNQGRQRERLPGARTAAKNTDRLQSRVVQPARLVLADALDVMRPLIGCCSQLEQLRGDGRLVVGPAPVGVVGPARFILVHR